MTLKHTQTCNVTYVMYIKEYGQLVYVSPLQEQLPPTSLLLVAVFASRVVVGVESISQVQVTSSCGNGPTAVI